MDYLEDWDHRMVWADFDEKLLFGHREAKAVPVAARKCLLKQVKLVTKYQNGLCDRYIKSNFLKRLIVAKKKFLNNPEDNSLWSSIDELDAERARYMIDSEKRCRARYSGGVQFSKEVNTKGAAICFLKLALKLGSGNFRPEHD